MAINFRVVEDNTAPSFTITCKRDGTVIDLSDATSVTLIIQNKGTSSITQAGKEATITSPTTGVITYSPDATDFPSAGTYVADVKVTYSGGSIERLYNQIKFKVRAKIS